MKILGKLLLAVIVLGGILVAFVYSGIYNIAADDPHLPVTRWLLDATMEHSVSRHARKVEVPANYNQADQMVGFKNYHEMCVGCHGAPGREQSEIAEGLNPKPPELRRTADEWLPGEVFWIVSHGIKMSGMAAFGKSHTDEEIWAIVSFVKHLPGLTAAEWKTLEETVGEESGDEGHEHHHH